MNRGELERLLETTGPHPATEYGQSLIAYAILELVKAVEALPISPSHADE